jgi:hypothetical protein
MFKNKHHREADKPDIGEGRYMGKDARVGCFRNYP